MAHRAHTVRWLPVLLLGVVVGCRKDTKAEDSAAAVAVVVPDTAAPAAVAVEATPTGEVMLKVAGPPGTGVFLTDANGNAVYILDQVPTGAAAANWKPVTGKAMAAPGDTSVKSGMVGSTTRADGTQQATYGGKPLYYYTPDQAGQTGGRGKDGASLVSPSGGKSQGAKP